MQFLTGGIGIPAPMLWPWSGGVTLGLMALSLVFLGRAWAFRPAERPRIFGLAAFLLAMLALGAAVGWGRGWAGDQAGFQERYITMATPLLCWIAFALPDLCADRDWSAGAERVVRSAMCLCLAEHTSRP